MATTTDQVKDAIDEGADAASTGIIEAADRAAEATRRAKQAAKEAVDSGRDTLEGALICAKDMVRANPVMAVATVAAIAYLWGRLKR
ncbi:hypothetical protein EKL30_15515 [Candidimonas sp. SYP-B2681]|uniref:hypothetical protein n=1 Tax=Candidimonas sp. SYP-B2681 TaxID=2497686 RepID=UPI000F876C46|nr:hypothetical protein [Candidimonas sp. SYP-B2681]RTZ41095.1 hypothetical protein EKL30_15515 [Candidimonas sp. SYP-B2681]